MPENLQRFVRRTRRRLAPEYQARMILWSFGIIVGLMGIFLLVRAQVSESGAELLLFAGGLTGVIIAIYRVSMYVHHSTQLLLWLAPDVDDE